MPDCALHKYHSPRPDAMHRHHVLPISWGGRSESPNVIFVCPTGHENLHALLNHYVRARGKPPWDVIRRYSPKERMYAHTAWMRRKDKTPITKVSDSVV